jgi:hypothetical protein
MLPLPPVGFFELGFTVLIPSVVEANLGSGSVDLDFIVLIAVPANSPLVNILDIQIAVFLDIVLLVSTTFGVCSIPGIVIDSDTNPRINLGAGSMTDGNADGACLLWVVRVLGTTTYFADALSWELSVTRLIPIVSVVPITDKSIRTRKLRYL